MIQPECAAPAEMVSTTASGVSLAWTGFQALRGNATDVDLAMAASTMTLGKNGNPYVAVGASVVQWAWDVFHPQPSNYH